MNVARRATLQENHSCVRKRAPRWTAQSRAPGASWTRQF